MDNDDKKPDMSELLARLKVADPGTWDIVNENTGMFQFDDPRRDDIIQGCIQRAIAARGWHCQIGMNPECLSPAWAYIFLKDCRPYLGEAESPALAILGAYLEAVEGCEQK